MRAPAPATPQRARLGATRATRLGEIPIGATPGLRTWTRGLQAGARARVEEEEEEEGGKALVSSVCAISVCGLKAWSPVGARSQPRRSFPTQVWPSSSPRTKARRQLVPRGSRASTVSPVLPSLVAWRGAAAAALESAIRVWVRMGAPRRGDGLGRCGRGRRVGGGENATLCSQTHWTIVCSAVRSGCGGAARRGDSEPPRSGSVRRSEALASLLHPASPRCQSGQLLSTGALFELSIARYPESHAMPPSRRATAASAAAAAAAAVAAASPSPRRRAAPPEDSDQRAPSPPAPPENKRRKRARVSVRPDETDQVTGLDDRYKLPLADADAYYVPAVVDEATAQKWHDQLLTLDQCERTSTTRCSARARPQQALTCLFVGTCAPGPGAEQGTVRRSKCTAAR